MYMYVLFVMLQFGLYFVEYLAFWSVKLHWSIFMKSLHEHTFENLCVQLGLTAGMDVAVANTSHFHDLFISFI